MREAVGVFRTGNALKAAVVPSVGTLAGIDPDPFLGARIRAAPAGGDGGDARPDGPVCLPTRDSLGDRV